MHRLVLPIAFALAAAAPAAASAERIGDLEISQAWSRPAAAGTNGVGFLTVTNRGAADTLIGAESPIARTVEIHSSSMANGVMTMRRETALAAPANGAVTLAPGGRHLMLIGLTRALKAGDKAPVVLIFARAGRVKVDLTVGLAAPGGHDGMHH